MFSSLQSVYFLFDSLSVSLSTSLLLNRGVQSSEMAELNPIQSKAF